MIDDGARREGELTAAEVAPDLDDGVAADLSDHLLEARARSEIGQAALAAVAVFVFWLDIDPRVSLPWFGTLLGLLALRTLHRNRAIPRMKEAVRRTELIRRDVWLSAAMWAAFAVALVGASVSQFAILLIIFAGLIAAATSTLMADSKSFYGFLLLLLVPLAAAVSASGQSRGHLSLLLLMLLYGPFMVSVHRRGNATLRELFSANRRLRASEHEAAAGRDFMDALVAEAPVCIAVLDGQGLVQRTNPAFERVTGLSFADVEGRDLPSLMGEGGDAAGLASFIDGVREGGRPVSELQFRGREGRMVWMRVSGTLAGSMAEGSAILVGADVTGQVESRKALEQARAEAEEMAQAKSSFLARMSHEIRTPMNGVLGMLEILGDTELTPEQRSSLDTATSSGTSLLGVINDILDFSKIEAGQLELETIPFDLPRVVSDAARVVSVSASARRNELSLVEDPDVPPIVLGDPGRLRQVLLNLLSNAVKFTEGGDIVLSTRLEGRDEASVTVTISLRDSGVGIAEDRLDSVFEEFSQADTSTTRRFGGTGLGLTISKRLVEQMGGELLVESRAGEGTHFWTTLTFDLATEGPITRRARDRTSLSGRRVLIVDDNEVARRISRKPIERAGGEVAEATSADEGISLLREAVESGPPFDAVVIDALMPEKDGFELAQEVRSDAKLTGTRMLMLTSTTHAHGPAKAREAGIRGYLTKPVTQAELITALHTLLSLRGPGEDEERRLVTREVLEDARATSRVLLVDDNKVNRQIASTMLTKRGHQVDQAGNGLEAIDMVEENEYDVVLMDLEMPEMGGLEATERIRARPEHAQLRIVALTAHALEEERARCKEAGMNGFLTKPFRGVDLYRVVEDWA